MLCLLVHVYVPKSVVRAEGREMKGTHRSGVLGTGWTSDMWRDTSGLDE